MGVELVTRYTQHTFDRPTGIGKVGVPINISHRCRFHHTEEITRPRPCTEVKRNRNRKISPGMMVLKNERREQKMGTQAQGWARGF